MQLLLVHPLFFQAPIAAAPAKPVVYGTPPENIDSRKRHVRRPWWTTCKWKRAQRPMRQLWLGDWARRVVYLVGCGKSKAPRATKARELYTGNLFQAARRHVEALGLTWRILSAKLGVVDPDKRVKPYDSRVPKRDADVACWAHCAAHSVLRQFGDHVAVVCLAGEDYAGPLAAHLADLGIPCERPLVGLQVGQRLSWFKARRA